MNVILPFITLTFISCRPRKNIHVFSVWMLLSCLHLDALSVRQILEINYRKSNSYIQTPRSQNELTFEFSRQNSMEIYEVRFQFARLLKFQTHPQDKYIIMNWIHPHRSSSRNLAPRNQADDIWNSTLQTCSQSRHPMRGLDVDKLTKASLWWRCGPLEKIHEGWQASLKVALSSSHSRHPTITIQPALISALAEWATSFFPPHIPPVVYIEAPLIAYVCTVGC